MGSGRAPSNALSPRWEAGWVWGMGGVLPVYEQEGTRALSWVHAQPPLGAHWYHVGSVL